MLSGDDFVRSYCILDYLLSLKWSSLSVSFIRVATISTNHPPVNFVNSPLPPPNKGASCFLGPQSGFNWHDGTSIWTCDNVLSTSIQEGDILGSHNLAGRVSEIKALKTGPPYTVFHKDKVTLRPNPKFLPRWSQTFTLINSYISWFSFQNPLYHSWNEITHFGHSDSLSFFIWIEPSYWELPFGCVAFTERGQYSPLHSDYPSGSETASGLAIRWWTRLLQLISGHVALGCVQSLQLPSLTFQSEICRTATWSLI